MIEWLIGDDTIRIWNTNTPNPIQVIPGGGGEILTCDWTKYDQVKAKSQNLHNETFSKLCFKKVAAAFRIDRYLYICFVVGLL